MPKIGMGPLRRRQLIDAAITAIHEGGLADATVARIAQRAGVSPGIVHHYFAGKDDLLFSVMRSLLAAFRDSIIAGLERARTPRERLYAIIDASFDESQFSPQVMSAWLALYGSAMHAPQLRRLLVIYHRRLRSNLVFALRRLTDDETEALRLAESIAAMIDGFWLRHALGDNRTGPDAPRRLVHACLDGELERLRNN